MTGPRSRGAAIVTGGASGLGAAAVRMLAEAGFQVLIVDRDVEMGQRASALGGQNVEFFAADVTDSEAVDAAVSAAGASSAHGLRVSVACAGIGPIERLVGRRGAHRTSTFRAVVEVNLVGTFNLLRAASVSMVENQPDDFGERGVHVSTASIAAFEGRLGHVAYAASKAGVVGMTLPAARDLAEHAIRVCTVAPGLFRTPLMDGLPEQASAQLLEEAVFPHRLGQADEFADLVKTIVHNHMLNGETIRLDGAVRL